MNTVIDKDALTKNNNHNTVIRQYIRRGKGNNTIIGCLVAAKDEKTNWVKIGVSFLNPKDKEEVENYNKKVKAVNAISWVKLNSGGNPAEFPIESKKNAFDKELAVEIALEKAGFDVGRLKNTKLKRRELAEFIDRAKRYFKGCMISEA